MRLRLDLHGMALLVTLAAITSPVAAQSTRLGPVDGRGLPAVDTGRVQVGSAAPDFTLETMTGDTVTLSQYRGQKHVILVFYRGHW